MENAPEPEAEAATDDEPAPEPEAAIDNEPELEPEPVDLASVDWLEQTWTTDCNDDGSMLTTELTFEDGLGGVRRPEDGALTPVYVVELDGVVFGDVTGDGQDDAVFITQCVWASAEHYLEVWSHDGDGQPQQLPSVDHYSKFDAVLDEVEIFEGKLRVHTLAGAPGDDFPHINGYPVAVMTDWVFEDGSWNATEIERIDTSPATPQAPARDATDAMETTGFVLPSGNIYCLSLPPEWLDAAGPLLECRIDSGLSPEPSEVCWGGEGGDWAGMHLPGNEPGEPVCFSDSLRQEVQDHWVLDYGATWRRDGFECSSSEQGLRCSNPSGNGLQLARNSWSAW